MATARVSPPASRRNPSISSTSSTNPSITRGATARSAANTRVSSSLSSPARRGSVKAATPPPVNAESREALSASLKQETEHKEQLLVQLQNKEQTIETLVKENGSLTSALNAADNRLSELYTEQNRMEEELSARIEVVEKLRFQVRDLEREKRDLQRRYNEQTSTFDAERQAFYDNEQHLKSRIQSLTQARKEPAIPRSPSIIIDSASETDVTDDEDEPSQPTTPSQQTQSLDADSEPAEMTSLRLELSTLSTSHSSLQSTFVLLQSQLVDLKRVNHELQEENESYNILLRERTLSGTFDLMKQVGGTSVTSSERIDEENEEDDDSEGDVKSTISRPRSTLGTVHEHAEEILDPDFDNADKEASAIGDLEQDQEDAAGSPARSSRHPRHGRRRTTSTTSHSPSAARGESLADLPITGPGLDLAAELGRAENKDILEGRAVDEPALGKGKRTKKSSAEARKISYSSEPGALDTSGGLQDVESLRTEIKSLKDANKALSLYASKIIDRIISQEGFEHVLAVDYEKLPPTPSTANGPDSKTPTATTVTQKIQRRATMFSRSTSNPVPPSPRPERLTTFDSPPLNSPNTSGGLSPTPTATRQRRSLSFDWRGFSVFGGGEKKDNTNLRPLTLKAGTPTITSARKLETEEDEEDRRERERLNATMKLMGIDKPAAPPGPIQKSHSTPVNAPSSGASTPNTSSSNRFSFFRRQSSNPNSDAGSTKSLPSGTPDMPVTLTQEALVQAEAENSLAALDARERALSADLAKGYSGGFTEIAPRRKSGSRRSRTSGEGSGSTVWSAGMSRGEDEGDE
ncbi:hypothetical protein DENSPDRAFT_869517 [Dentipellis sp. KUC8613]|nr:hypothetical protein DENSPDRAFT_869517 [Dentipellis sp. KUC8613]